MKQKQQTKQTNNTTKSKYAREVYINLKYKREKKAKQRAEKKFVILTKVKPRILLEAL